jgi:hypothetical protein
MNKPQTVDELFPSPYLKHDDVGDQDLILTISKFDFEEIGIDQPEMKGVLYFEETDKKLVLNKTNASTIGDMYGNNINQWIGKQIAVYKTEVSFGSKMVMAIRVRIKPPKNEQPVQPELLDPPPPENWVE